MPVMISCGGDDDDPDDEGGGGGNGGGQTTATTGTIVVKNAYTSVYYGNISTVAIINSKDKYVKSTGANIKKDQEKEFIDIPVDTYTVKITITDRLGPKVVEKTGIKVTAGKKVNVVFN